MPRLMLLDAHSLIYRAYFALLETPLATSDGRLVNAAFGFWTIVLRGVADVQPDYVVACFDVGRSFRKDRYAGYKATRRPTPDDLRAQIPIVRETLAALGIPVRELDGFEGDDVIGTLSRAAEAEGFDVTIVSGDLDMLQLVTEHVSLLTTRQGVGATVIYDPAKVAERYGLRPDQMIDFKALKGDATDNIPGLSGVGDKTAAKLLTDFGSLDAALARVDEVTPPKLREQLREHADELRLWRELVTIERDLPVALDLDGARLGEYDRDAVVRLFRALEFRTLIDRLPRSLRGPGTVDDGDATAPGAAPAGRAAAPRRDAPGAGERRTVRRPAAKVDGLQLSLDLGAPDAATAVRVAAAGPAQADGEDARARLARWLAAPFAGEPPPEADAFAAWLAAQPEVTVAARFDDPHPRRATLAAFAVVGRDGRTFAAEGAAAEALAGAVLGADRPLVGHDLKPLLAWELARRDPAGRTSLTASGGHLPSIAVDTQIAAYLLNAALRSQSLADICAERLGVTLPDDDPGPATSVVRGAIAAAAVRDALGEALAGEPALTRLLAELELPLIPVLADLEATGVAIDRARLAALSTDFATEIARLEEEIHASVGHAFNLGSPKQLEHVLFTELGLPPGKRTKTGYSTDASVLEDLRPAHPMVGMLLDWRLYTKLRSTYVEALPALIAPATGRLHTTFQQTVAATGRLSSTDPNLQNIPIRTDLGRRIRRAFVAGDPERVLLAADYSQIELRVLAHVSGDAHLRQAFADRTDIHRETAARVLHKDPADVTPDERSMAKMVNFGLAYGMSDFGLSSRAGISRAEAQAFIAGYFGAYAGIATYMVHVRELARSQGYVETLLGRRRAIPELAAANAARRAAGERMAINMPIQGTAADIMKIAMVRLHARLAADRSPARMLLSVHDEVVLEVPRAAVAETAAVVRSVMESALPLDVPLDVEVKAGDDWESMTPIPRS
ncbi:MAG: DNA polymerase I [Chloroflexota bacterium]